MLIVSLTSMATNIFFFFFFIVISFCYLIIASSLELLEEFIENLRIHCYYGLVVPKKNQSSWPPKMTILKAENHILSTSIVTLSHLCRDHWADFLEPCKKKFHIGPSKVLMKIIPVH